MPPAPEGLHGTPDNQQQSMWAQPPPKPLEEIIPQEVLNNPLHPMTKPQIEDLPEYLLVQGMPEVEGHAEPENVDTNEPLPTPPNPTSANQHIFNFHRPQRPQSENNDKQSTFQNLPIFDTQKQAIQPASQSIQPASLYDLVEFYAGISYDKNAVHSFTCHFDFFYFTPHPLSCQKFIICSNKMAYEHQCGDGVYFDYLSTQCTLPKSAACFKDTHDIEYETNHIDIHETSNERPDDYYGHTEEIDPGFNVDWHPDTPPMPERPVQEETGPDDGFTSNENQGWGDWVPPGLEGDSAKWGNDFDGYLEFGKPNNKPFYASVNKDSEITHNTGNGFGKYQGWNNGGEAFQQQRPAKHGGFQQQGRAPHAEDKYPGYQYAGYESTDQSNGYHGVGDSQNGYFNGEYHAGNTGFMTVSENIAETDEPASEEAIVPVAASVEVVPAVAVEEPQVESDEEKYLPGNFSIDNMISIRLCLIVLVFTFCHTIQNARRMNRHSIHTKRIAASTSFAFRACRY